MNKIYQLIFVKTFILWWLSSIHSQGMGPFEMEFRGFGLCPDVKLKNPAITNPKFSKVGRKKYIVNFDVYAKYPLSDDITCKIEVAIKTPNGFKRRFFNLETPLVSAFKTYVPDYYKTVKWPVPPGNYSIRNLTLQEPEHTLIPSFFYNTYKLTSNMYMKNELLGCVESMLQLVPKKKS